MHRESSLQRPTRVRFIVLAFVCALSMITYLDRVCFGTAAPHLVRALDLQGVEDLSWAFFAFAFAYAAFEIPTGWLGDVFGPRRTLIRIVLWWSFFTALTGLVGMVLPKGLFLGLTALVVIRFMFGMGEAGAYPNITRALHNWFPFQERGLAQGAVWMGGRLMGGLTPLLWWLLVEGITYRTWREDLVVSVSSVIGPLKPEGQLWNFLGSVGLTQSWALASSVLIHPLLSWRQTFWIFGALGLVWCALFALWFRNRPEEKKRVNEAERKLITGNRPPEIAGHEGVPWRKIVTSSNLWILCLMYFCGAYGWYFNITYLPSFLEEQYQVDPKSLAGALYKGGPLWVGALACLTGGWLSDWFIRRTGNRKWGRRLFGVVGHSLCAICYLTCLVAPNAFLFFLAISLAAFWNDMTMGSSWATCQDIGKRYAAIVAGCMNTVGNLGGAVAAKVTGWILKGSLSAYLVAQGLDWEVLDQVEKKAVLAPGHWWGYQINLLTFGLVYVVAVLLWLRVDSTKPIVPEGK